MGNIWILIELIKINLFCIILTSSVASPETKYNVQQFRKQVLNKVFIKLEEKKESHRISNHFLQVYRSPDLTMSSVIIFHALCYLKFKMY